jgi:ABC-type cobalamin transport system permease subunit
MVTIRTPSRVIGSTAILGFGAFGVGFFGAEAIPSATPIAIGMVGVVVPGLLALSLVTDTARLSGESDRGDVVVRILAWLVVTLALLALSGLALYVYSHPAVAP